MTKHRNPTLEILSDTHAVIVKGDVRFELTGTSPATSVTASRIIAAYRHMLTHGQVTADTYLMGVIDGMRHIEMVRAEAALAEVRERYRLDKTPDRDGTL